MSLSSTTSRVSYTGAGNTATYDYTFRIQDEDDLRLTVSDGTTDTRLVLTTDYTVTGVGDASGGTIVLVSAGQAWLNGSGYLTSSYTLDIRRVPALTQAEDLRNQGEFYAETHEDAFDRFVMIDQAQQDEIDRSVKLPETITSATFDPTLPTNITTGNRVITTNQDGDGLEIGPDVDTIADGLALASFFGTGLQPLTEAAIGNGVTNQAISGLTFDHTVNSEAHIVGWIRRKTNTAGTERISRFILDVFWLEESSTWGKNYQEFSQSDSASGVELSINSSGQVIATSTSLSGAGYTESFTYRVETA